MATFNKAQLARLKAAGQQEYAPGSISKGDNRGLNTRSKKDGHPDLRRDASPITNRKQNLKDREVRAMKSRTRGK
jgi:hypothetical protein